MEEEQPRLSEQFQHGEVRISNDDDHPDSLEIVGIPVKTEAAALELLMLFWEETGTQMDKEQAARYYRPGESGDEYTGGIVKTVCRDNLGDDDVEYPYVITIRGNNQPLPEKATEWLKHHGFVKDSAS